VPPRLTSRTAAAAPAAPLSTPVFQILLSLVDATLHGYAIIQDVRARTDSEVRLTASTLYAAVKRLLDAGWIEELERSRVSETDDSRRRYYRITIIGREAARVEARRLERLTAQARAKRLIPEPRPSVKGAS
jgi:DNA-binding PadR family transcriptional regulator